jgi:putative phosphoesterase
MPRVIIIADIHGFYPAWQAIAAILRPEDTLAVAGDFFDTRYGDQADNTYQPELIRDAFNHLSIPKYYVYGNCDEPAFCPGHDYGETFTFEGKKIFLTHGHFCSCPEEEAADIRIEGHTHKALIKRREKSILLNPGSIPLPRNGFRGYAVIENQKIRLVSLNP